MIWHQDHAFKRWLDVMDVGTENPVSEDILDMMYEAWIAGCEHGRALAQKDALKRQEAETVGAL